MTKTSYDLDIDVLLGDLLGDRPEVGVWVTWWGVDPTQMSAVVELTRQTSNRCGRCGQEIQVSRPGPVVSFDAVTGAPNGGHSHQHGCGEWNAPEAVACDVDFDATEAGCEATIRRLVADLDAQVAEVVAEAEAAVKADLAGQIIAARARLSEPLDGDETAEDRLDELGDEGSLEPCVYLGGDQQLVAWDWSPLTLPDQYDEGIAMHESGTVL
jgi:hypothetical protein